MKILSRDALKPGAFTEQGTWPERLRTVIY